MRIAINGFGRIGRAVFRAAWSRSEFEVVHVNDLTNPEMLAYLLQYDTVHGKWGPQVRVVEGALEAEGRRIGLGAEPKPGSLPWAQLGVDVVLECTGAFNTREKAAAHLTAGARRVILSAPAKGAVDATLVMGVNHLTYDPSQHFIVSNGSCTTNCLAPVARVLHDLCGIERGTMNTVHAYTADQNLVDGPHRSGKLRRARAAAANIVPTSTGAAKAVGLVIPELAGRLDGLAVRVPVPDGSLLDLVVWTTRPTTREAVLQALQAAADGPMKGILAVSQDELVSSDIVGNPHSAIVDAVTVSVLGEHMVRVMAWYDNEWAFSVRMLDIANILGGTP